MANKLIVAPAPHVHGSESTQKIMRDVLLALTPALVFSVVAFGWSALDFGGQLRAVRIPDSEISA